MRVALLGGGTIARLVLERRPPGIEFAALCGRGPASRGVALAREFGVPYVSDRTQLLGARPEVVIEAASHDAVRLRHRHGPSAGPEVSRGPVARRRTLGRPRAR